MDNSWAILIGVDYYIPGAVRHGMNFPSLSGCVDDVNQMEEYLVDSSNTPSSRIYKLTATIPDTGSLPKEDPSRWPTYDNIIALFRKITDEASPRDAVYIHYSGHGARVKTIFTDLKHQDALDEALVPTDIACDGGRYVRDVEIALMMRRMVDKELVVTLVMDCCHSGGANRGHQGRTMVRGLQKADMNQLNTDKSDFPSDELRILRTTIPSDGRRTARVDTNWMLEVRGYTFLAACRPHEFAREFEFNDGTHGIFTYYLIDTLKRSSVRLTYRQLCAEIFMRVRNHSDQQNVMLLGEGDRLFLSENRKQVSHACFLTSVTYDAAPSWKGSESYVTAELDAGRAHGVSPGMEFDVWPRFCADFSDFQRLARFRVRTVSDLTADAVLIQSFNTEQPVEPGCQALPLSSMFVPRRVRLVYPDPDYDSSSAKALDKLKCRWQQRADDFIRLSDESDQKPSLEIHVRDGHYEVRGTGGSALHADVPSIPIDAHEAMLRCLVHLAKYHSVLGLKGSDDSGLSPLSVDLIPKPEYFPIKSSDIRREHLDRLGPLHNNHTIDAAANDWILLRVQNTTDEFLNVTILDLDSSWSITQIYPAAPDTLYEPLEPRGTIDLPLKTTMSDGKLPRIIDTVKIFATVEHSSFRWLELPELEAYVPRHANAVSRGNALNVLHSAMMQGRLKTRKVATYVPSKWTTVDLTILPRLKQS